MFGFTSPIPRSSRSIFRFRNEMNNITIISCRLWQARKPSQPRAFRQPCLLYGPAWCHRKQEEGVSSFSNSFQRVIDRHIRIQKYRGKRVARLLKSCVKQRAPLAAAAGITSLALALPNQRTNPTAPQGEGRKRSLTNSILAANAICFALQVLTRGTLLTWGAKVNSGLAKGQVYRLLTAAFLHVDLFHLLVNSYSLYNIGPQVESFCGRQRFYFIYLNAAIAGNLVSWALCPTPAAGASGAIMGLAGCLTVYYARHHSLMGKRGKKELKQLQQVVVLNLLLGVFVSRIDNWGHVGGLLGGSAAAWLVGPNLELEKHPVTRISYLVDRPPLQKFLQLL